MPNPTQIPGSSDNSLLTGGLAGILASTVFGGPIGAAVGIGAGLLSSRMHRSELDLLTDDYNAVQDYGSKIQDQVKTMQPFVDRYGGDFKDIYSTQLTNISDEAARAQQLAQHVDPMFRQAGLAQLANTGSKIDALHADIEAKTQKQADTVAAQEEDMRKHFQSEFETTQTKTRQLISDADEAQMAIHDDPKIEKVQTKFALMKMLGMTSREAKLDAGSFSIGLLGTGFDKEFDLFSPSYDEAVKMIENKRATEIKNNTDYMQQIIGLAAQNGFHFGADADGKISVHNVGSVVQRFREMGAFQTPGTVPPGSRPAEPGTKFDPNQLPGNAENLGGAVMGGLKDTTTAVGDFLQGVGIPRLDNKIKEGASDSADALSKYSSDAVNSFMELRARNRKRIDDWKAKHRPTNR